MSWVRLWLDMPTDPKWRVIARKSGQPIALVIATYNFLMVNAAANATERGRTHGWNNEDVSAALDVSEAEISSIIAAMQGKVLDGEKLSGWEKRQPKREDSSAERAKKWRAERNRTQPNATERPDIDADADTELPLPKGNGASPDPSKIMFDAGVALLTAAGKSEGTARGWLGKAKKAHGAEAVIIALGKAQREGAIDPIPYMERCLRTSAARDDDYGPC